eukprot:CAMPEP_0197413954 /NCGR_PEP_ID=MMETSP1170-20131217/756_1 /TAXON_ID=54406 /ORGANISM="Sarcinochrysis sp, Strain CCMP770" /LENGTH=124 /DNA_ID=CAMNT_0042940617 /DNA_START=56 /DNA_END=427 /DNA_ORIENTATION=+
MSDPLDVSRDVPLIPAERARRQNCRRQQDYQARQAGARERGSAAVLSDVRTSRPNVSRPYGTVVLVLACKATLLMRGHEELRVQQDYLRYQCAASSSLWCLSSCIASSVAGQTRGRGRGTLRED